MSRADDNFTKEIFEIPIGQIDVGERIREDMGDLESLAESIASEGLINPIVVQMPDQGGSFRLLAGHRRLLAMQLLGRSTVPCRIARAGDGIEIAENGLRKQLSPIETGKAASILRPLVRPRRGESSNQAIGRLLGVSGYHVAKCLAIWEYASTSPEAMRDMEARLSKRGGMGEAYEVASTSHASVDRIGDLSGLPADAPLVYAPSKRPEAASVSGTLSALFSGDRPFAVAITTMRDLLTAFGSPDRTPFHKLVSVHIGHRLVASFSQRPSADALHEPMDHLRSSSWHAMLVSACSESIGDPWCVIADNEQDAILVASHMRHKLWMDSHDLPGRRL